MKSYKKMLKNTFYAALVLGAMSSYGQKSKIKVAKPIITSIPVSSSNGLMTVSDVDINDDKYMDMIITSKAPNVEKTSNVYLLLSNKEGGFEKLKHIGIVPLASGDAITCNVANYNNDNHKDIMVIGKMPNLNKEGRIYYFENDEKETSPTKPK